MTARRNIRRRGTRGFVLATMMATASVLLVCIGLTIDTAYLQLVKTRMQTAADAAALGAVNEYKANGASGITTAAKTDSALNGFTDSANNVTVTVNRPPLSGFYTGDSTAVEVLVSQSVNVFFMSVLGFGSTTVRARSVARLGSGTSCVYVLDPSASHTLQASGGATVAVGCGVIVDSNSSSALQLSGGARLAATSVSVVGNYSVSGGATVSPAPVTNSASVRDPLSYLSAPSIGSCNQTSYSLSGGTATISAGVYCKGISVSGGGQLTLNAGTYILLGGGLSVSGGSTLTGTGVTFFLTAGTGKPYGGISFSGGANITLTAPATGSYAGILFYQDPGVGSASSSTFSGGTTVVLTGALYFPTTDLSYSGGSGGSYTILVAKTISFSGGTTVNADYSSLPAGSPVKGNAALAE